ncbi:MAG: hypothetical protein JW769_04640 [Parachlamydiales bacterium]|nr:hypothetical protein [Parachlamydiales bacterium]
MKKPVKESDKTKRAREKLEKQLEAIERRITPAQLEKKNLEIHHWIACNARHRVVLQKKNIALFDENQNVAQTSKSIQKIAASLQNQMKDMQGIFKSHPLAENDS